MAISGNNDVLRDTSHVMDSQSYSNVVGNYKGETRYVNADGRTISSGEYNYLKNDKFGSGIVYGKTSDYSADYVLKGKAGITSNFYNAFSNAFDEYKGIINKDLNNMVLSPNVKQAFSGTEIESAVKNLIEAVKKEAEDYLFKLERAEKTVIHSIQQAFEKQQSQMGSSMRSDTSKLYNGNSTSQERSALIKNDKSWSGQPNTVSSGVNNVTAPSGSPRNYVSQSTL